jgi:hypothetical protein
MRRDDQYTHHVFSIGCMYYSENVKERDHLWFLDAGSQVVKLISWLKVRSSGKFFWTCSGSSQKASHIKWITVDLWWRPLVFGVKDNYLPNFWSRSHNLVYMFQSFAYIVLLCPSFSPGTPNYTFLGHVLSSEGQWCMTFYRYSRVRSLKLIFNSKLITGSRCNVVILVYLWK